MRAQNLIFIALDGLAWLLSHIYAAGQRAVPWRNAFQRFLPLPSLLMMSIT